MPIARTIRTLRLPPDLDSDVIIAAERLELSVNRWVILAIRERLLAEHEAGPTVHPLPPGVVVDAHADRYPPVTPPTVGPAAPVHYHRPVGSFDPDTDTPA